MKHFDINTVTILRQASTDSNTYLVKAKVIGGKRYKRGYMKLNKDDIRHIKMKELGVK